MGWLRSAWILRIALGLAASLATLAFLASGAAATTTNTFVGGLNGDDWNTAGNWSLGHVPLATEDVSISGLTANLTTGPSAVAHSVTISSTGALALSGETLSVGSGASSVAGDLSVTNSTVTVNGTFTAPDNGRIDLDGGTLDLEADASIGAVSISRGNSNPGTLKVGSGATLTKTGTGNATVSPPIDNHGTVDVAGGTLRLGSGGPGAAGSGYVIASDATLLVDVFASLESPSITGSGTAALVGGRLTVGATDTFDSAITVDLRDGTFELDRQLSLAHLVVSSGGTISGTGGLTVTDSADLSTGLNLASTSLTLAATIPSVTITQALNATNATVTLLTPTTVASGANVGLDGSTLNVEAALSISTTNVSRGNSNPGLLHVISPGTITQTGGTARITAPIDNDGTVSVQAGALQIAGGDAGSTTGSFSIAAGATLALDGGSLRAPSITGAGTASVFNADLIVGATDVFGVDTLDLEDGTFTANQALSVNHFIVGFGGVLNGTGGVTVTQGASLTTGFNVNDVTLTFAASLPSLTIGATINATNSRIVLQTPTTLTTGVAIGLDGATLELQSPLSVSDTVINRGNSNPGLVQIDGPSGALTKSASGSAEIRPPVQTAGALTVQAGTINATGGLMQTDGTTNVASGAELDGPVTLNGGTLSGGGTLGGSVSNNGGTVAAGGGAPGTLTIAGDYTQGAAATLAADIDGTSPATGFDQLHVAGTATLDGTLAVTVGAFAPAEADAFKVVTGATSRTGTFAQLTGAVVNGFAYVAHYDNDGVTLIANQLPVPVNTVPPSISGAPVVGATVTCLNGSWTNAPGAFAYQWQEGGHAIPGATSQTLMVPALDEDDLVTMVPDEDDLLSCTVTASNASGSGQPVTSPQVMPLAPASSQPPSSAAIPSPPGVPKTRPETTSCPQPTGSLHGGTLGRLFLGIERQRAERTLGPFTRRRGIDDFCLAGDREIVAGFPSVSLLARVPEAVAKALKGRAVLLVTTNPFYATHSGVRPGMTLAEARTQQPLHNPIASGGERWYVTRGSKAASLVAARGGMIRTVGLAAASLVKTRTDQVALLRSFGL